MDETQAIQQPIKRSKLRQILGKEYYILKTKIAWWLSSRRWAGTIEEPWKRHEVFTHRSPILRQLKDVDMYLQENKRTNLRIAIRALHGLVIKPGETFSFWKQVGRPTKKKGYLDGLILQQGQLAKGTGGGLCQLGNLLFWIFAHSPLAITQRWRHGFDVFPDVHRTIPFGAGATLSYNHVDLQITNKTDSDFQLLLWLDDTYLNGSLLSTTKPLSYYQVVERNHSIRQQIWGGYSRHNQIFQIEYSQDQIISEKLLVENHAMMMYSPLLEMVNIH
jgi:vancomycin resistance protein VanW